MNSVFPRKVSFTIPNEFSLNLMKSLGLQGHLFIKFRNSLFSHKVSFIIPNEFSLISMKSLGLHGYLLLDYFLIRSYSLYLVNSLLIE
jgi:hypothetical protein